MSVAAAALTIGASAAPAGAPPIARGAARFSVAPATPPSFGEVGGGPLLDAFRAPQASAPGRRDLGAFARLDPSDREPPAVAMASAAEGSTEAAPPSRDSVRRRSSVRGRTAASCARSDAIRQSNARPSADRARCGSRSPHHPRRAKSARRRRLARRAGRNRGLLRRPWISAGLGRSERPHPRRARGARAARARFGGRPRPVGLRSAPQRRRRPRPNGCRCGRNLHLRRRRRLRRTGERIANRPLARLAAVRGRTARRRSRRRAR